MSVVKSSAATLIGEVAGSGKGEEQRPKEVQRWGFLNWNDKMEQMMESLSTTQQQQQQQLQQCCVITCCHCMNMSNGTQIQCHAGNKEDSSPPPVPPTAAAPSTHQARW